MIVSSNRINNIIFIIMLFNLILGLALGVIFQHMGIELDPTVILITCFVLLGAIFLANSVEEPKVYSATVVHGIVTFDTCNDNKQYIIIDGVTTDESEV